MISSLSKSIYMKMFIKYEKEGLQKCTQALLSTINLVTKSKVKYGEQNKRKKLTRKIN